MKWNVPVGSREWKSVWDRYKYILLVVLAGILLLLPDGQGKQMQPVQTTQREMRFDLEQMEKKLERILGQIQGAGEVSVMLTLRESGQQILARDTEVSQTEQRATNVILSQGSGVQQVVPLQQIYPKFQGALIVCAGAGDARVKLELMEAVRALTGLSAEKISICKR